VNTVPLLILMGVLLTVAHPAVAVVVIAIELAVFAVVGVLLIRKCAALCSPVWRTA
jgi:hypothetical protein